jgi:hypothetical protein
MLYTVQSKTGNNLGNGINYVDFSVSPAYKGGNINILNDFKWTTGGQNDEVPYLLLQELQLNFGQIIQNLAGNLTSAINMFDTKPNVNIQNTDPNDPYSQLYSATPTGFNYVFPHLLKDGDSIKGSTHNTWKRNNIASMAGSAAAGILETAAGVVSKGAAEGVRDLTNTVRNFFGNELVGSGLGLEDIVTYSSTTPKQLKVSFPLYNTFTEKDARLNFDFVNLFGLQNLKTRTSFATFLPPKIYVIESPGQGGIYMPAAFVKSYDVISIGTTRFMNSGQYSADASNYQYLTDPKTNTKSTGGSNAPNSNGILIPEAYKVNITFEEIIPQSANIMWGSLGGQKVSVINPTTGSSVNTSNNVPNIPGTEFNQPNFMRKTK